MACRVLAFTVFMFKLNIVKVCEMDKFEVCCKLIPVNSCD